MSAPSPPPSPPDAVYLRGQRVAAVDTGRFVRFVVVAGFALLVVLVVVTTVGAADQNSVQTRLQRHGVPVVVTVTGCEGVSSGIGQSISYYHCTGSFVLHGHRYAAVIGGNRAALTVGSTLAGVTVASDPALLSTATAVARRFSRTTPYVTPVVLAAVTVVLGAVVAVVARRRRRVRDEPASPPAPE